MGDEATTEPEVKTCVAGHPVTGENAYWPPSAQKRGKPPRCRRCRDAMNQLRRDREYVNRGLDLLGGGRAWVR